MCTNFGSDAIGTKPSDGGLSGIWPPISNRWRSNCHIRRSRTYNLHTMKIMCQKHYDEVVRYAERIGDETLEERLNDLKRWERNPNRPCEIELYKDFAPYSFLFKQRYADGSIGVIGGLVYHGHTRPFGMLLRAESPRLGDSYVTRSSGRDSRCAECTENGKQVK